ncbi:CaiB/BaiF CoA transferase family protein [Mycobacterium sp.]|uniref:CaiB/BaiF CoA transferase family protein n=1 Tax=Mycobacterium sp. TaxID=1785 RepID=UPI003D0F72CB
MTETAQTPLDGIVVADLSSGIAGGYCTRLLRDGGATVIKLESPAGDPLRKWSASGRKLGGDDGALFKFLAGGKRSVLADPGGAAAVLASADIIVWSPGSELADDAALSPSALRKLAPHAVVVALTPFGLDGPWADKPSTEFTLQAWSGGMWHRGDPARAPVAAGGRTGDWLIGMIGAVSALSARWRALHTGRGELVDVSELESLILTHSVYPVTYASITGMPVFPSRFKSFPGIEQASDGLVGFMVVTGQQWLDFCVMVDKAEWLEDESLISLVTRLNRRDELGKDVDAWMGQHTVDEIIELATAFRIPVAPVGDGRTVTEFEHFRDGGYLAEHPGRGFLQPTPPYRLHDTPAGPASAAVAPALGEHTDTELPVRVAPAARGDTEPRLPFEGLRVADFTAFWAGPIVGHLLAILGADVIHVESVQRIDGMRYRAARPFDQPHWWETGPGYQGGNTNKRGLTLDMNSETGRELALDLVKQCDVVIENYTPRVTESWGLTYGKLKEVKPDVIMVRMPGFGLDGPWRDRSAYAQTMEAVSGLAWLAGYADEEPQFLNGPGDPVAGSHATIALLLALEHQRRTGQGMLIEAPMIGAALCIAAEQVIEYTAYGNLLTRDGNRGPTAAPQNLYLCADTDADGEHDQWVAVAVETDQQWRGLAAALDRDDWLRDAALAHAAGRRVAQDVLDAAISAWTATRQSAEVVSTLWAVGVPVGVVIPAERQVDNEQLQARGFFEEVDHPILGTVTHCGYPARFSAGPGRVNRSHAPLLGQHNHDILRELCGRSDEQIAEYERLGVIGTEVQM